jgi:hypothetical protein
MVEQTVVRKHREEGRNQMNRNRTIQMQAALTLLVAAAIPQVAHGAPQSKAHYVPFVTDFGRQQIKPAPTVHAPSSGFKPFQTDFARGPSGRLIAGVKVHQSTLDATRPDDRAGVHGIGGSIGAGAASHYTAQALRAMGGRYQAMAEYYASSGSRVTASSPQASSTRHSYVVGGEVVSANGSFHVPAAVRPDDRTGTLGIGASTGGDAASHYSPQALQAMGDRYQAMADYYKAAGSAPAASDSFDWRDAMIGAASGLGTALLLLGGLLLSLVGRRHKVAAL